MINYPENIFELVRTDRDDFLNNEVEVVPGFLFSQYDTIKKIHKYYNSQFEGSNYEEINGVKRKKTFYNINKWRCKVATKMIDIDVKDFLLIPTQEDAEIKTSLFSAHLKRWLKVNKFGKLLNEIAKYLPIYGSAVIQKTKDGAKLVDLRNLMNEQGAGSLSKSRYVIIKHLMSPSDLRKMNGKWNNVDEVIDKHCNNQRRSYEDSEDLNKGISYYAEVYEYFGEVPLSWHTDKEKDNNTWVLSRFFVAGIDRFTVGENNTRIYGEGIELFKEKITSLPFKEVHLDKTEGRWLGIGYVEDTFEAQRRVNEIKNQESKAMELASMIVYQTRDKLAANNAMSDMENGDILRVNSEITRINNQNTALPDFSASQSSYEALADRTTFSYDVIRGEAAPASSTLGAVQLQAQQAGSVYDYYRENIGLFLNEYLRELVFPEIEKDLISGKQIIFDGDPDKVTKYRRQAAEEYVAKEFIKKENYNIDSYNAEVDRVDGSLAKKWGGKLWITVNGEYFRNIDKFVDIEITGESKNIPAQIQNIQFLLQTIAGNQDVLRNKVLKRLLFQAMAMVGMDASQLELAEDDANEMAQIQQPQEQPQANLIPQLV